MRFSSFWGWLALPLHCLHPVMLRGAHSLPGGRIPPSATSSAGGPASAVLWCWAAPGLPGSGVRKHKSRLGCACQCWSCSEHRDCHVC